MFVYCIKKSRLFLDPDKYYKSTREAKLESRTVSGEFYFQRQGKMLSDQDKCNQKMSCFLKSSNAFEVDRKCALNGEKSKNRSWAYKAGYTKAAGKQAMCCQCLLRSKCSLCVFSLREDRVKQM